MPKLKEDIFVVPDGEIYPRWFRAGDDVPESIMRAAQRRGIVAQDAPKPKRKAMRAPENK